MRVFLHIDCVPLCFCFFQKDERRASTTFWKEFFEAENIQHVDSLLAREWRDDVVRGHRRTSSGNVLLLVRSHVACVSKPCVEQALWNSQR